MKIGILVAAFIILSPAVYAQTWVGLGMGANQSNLYYENSDGVKDNSIQGSPASYAFINYQFDPINMQTKEKKAKSPSQLVNIQLGYQNTLLQDKDSHTLNNWSLDFLTFTMGYRYILSSKKKLNPFVGAGVTTNFLLTGVQQIGLEQYDLKNELKKFYVGLAVEGGLAYTMSDEVLGTLGLTYDQGISNIEKDGQKSRLSGLKLGLGLMFRL